MISLKKQQEMHRKPDCPNKGKECSCMYGASDIYWEDKDLRELNDWVASQKIDK